MGKISNISRNDFLSLIKEFKSDAILAKNLNCSRQYVARLRKKFGISNTRDNIQKRNEKIVKEYQSMVPGIEISKKFNLSINQIYKIIRDTEGEKCKN